MRDPLETYGPGPEPDRAMAFPTPQPLRWLPWVQLALTSALLVLFISQVIEVQSINRKIARLHERMDQIESSRMLETAPAMEAQQRATQQRLAQLESAVRELASENQGSSGSSGGIPAFQIPPPPRMLP
ncbi:MAG: hypothetical protein VKP70_00255 [Cyanobacteriota bacterium]|nr:hypothetical protein [Cyanobacteriota bacterium]